MKFDFSGYATKNDLRCSDGRIIRKGAFEHNDGKKVPLLWEHLRNTPDNVIGHAILEHREDGVYAYGKFNNTSMGQKAKEAVHHGDIDKLSIHANELSQRGNDVVHGNIREVSLVVSGANPGASIDNLVIEHTDGRTETSYGEAIIHTDEMINLEDLELEIEHAEENQNGSETVEDVINSMSQKQKDVLYAMVAQAAGGKIDHSENEEKLGGEENMKHNVFDKETDPKNELTHSQFTEIMNDAKQFGSFRESFFTHTQDYGIENIDFLFPDFKNVTNPPEWIKRDTGWVQGVLNGVRKTPFSRIKSMAADITADEARAKGYVKGAEKFEEVFPLLKRTTGPTTIYKKQKLDRDDIIDITDMDVVAWLWMEMRMMLDEELARTVLIGDGREVLDPDKIDPVCIRPIAFDDNLYAHKVDLAPNVSGNSLIEAMIRARKHYKGSGTPTLYTTDALLIDLLLIKDKIGRRLYNTEKELASALRVKDIVVVEVMEALPNILGIFVNLNDYVLGADKGGEVNRFDDFDIDFNQYKYLLETRCSGALIRPKSALVFRRNQGTKATPTEPTFNTTTGVLTIPSATGVQYLVDDVEVTSGVQSAIDQGETIVVTVEPKEGYYFDFNITTSWEFTRDE